MTPALRALGLALVCLSSASASAQSHRNRGVHPGAVHPRDAGVPSTAVDLPPTHGTMDPAGTARVIQAHSAAVRRCYTAALGTDPGLHGHIDLRLRIEPDGSVSQTSLRGDNAMHSLGACLEAVFRHVLFPQPQGGAATVTAPFEFGASG